MSEDEARKSSDVSAAIAEHEREIASLSSALRDAEDVRKSLLLTGSNREIALHDSGMDRIRLDIERAAARVGALKAELPGIEAAEEQQRQEAVGAEIASMSARYEHLVSVAYPALTEPLIELLTELDVIGREIGALNRSVSPARRIDPESFRKDARNSRYFGPLSETTALPAVMQSGTALWPPPKAPVERREPVERPPVRLSEFAHEPVVNDARRADPGITVTRVPLDVWMRERDARLKAEERARAEGAR